MRRGNQHSLDIKEQKDDRWPNQEHIHDPLSLDNAGKREHRNKATQAPEDRGDRQDAALQGKPTGSTV